MGGERQWRRKRRLVLLLPHDHAQSAENAEAPREAPRISFRCTHKYGKASRFCALVVVAQDGRRKNARMYRIQATMSKITDSGMKLWQTRWINFVQTQYTSQQGAHRRVRRLELIYGVVHTRFRGGSCA